MLLGKTGAYEIHALNRFDVRGLLDRSAILRFLKQLQSDPVAKEELDVFGKTSPFPGLESRTLTDHLADLIVGGQALLESNLRQLFWRHHVSSLSKPYALLFLRRFSTSSGAMGNMREFVRKCKALPNACTMRDDVVQEQLASAIASGEAVIGFRTLNRIGGGVAPPFGPTAPPPPPASKVQPSWEPDPATFPASHDAGSQAQALLAAAQNGSPFCEECQKATQ